MDCNVTIRSVPCTCTYDSLGDIVVTPSSSFARFLGLLFSVFSVFFFFFFARLFSVFYFLGKLGRVLLIGVAARQLADYDMHNA